MSEFGCWHRFQYLAIHRIRRAWLRQMIYCAAGWVRVVYEDAGMEFVLRPVS